MANFLTNLLFEPKGKHDPTKTYTIKDTVMSPDGSQVYFALQDVPAGIALDNTEYWILQIDLHASKVELDNAAAAVAGAVSANVDQNLTETQKATARRNIGMDKVIESLSDPLEASGNPLVVNPVGGLPFDSVVTVLEPKQEGSGDPYPAGGGRNKLPNTATSQTVNGITFTVNADGSITANGTATADAEIIVYNVNTDANDYTGCVLSGCPAGGSGSTYFMRYSNKSDGINNDYGAGVTIDSEYTGAAAVIARIKSGVVASNLIFKPMLRLASDPDSTYAPPSNIRPITGWDAVEMNHAGVNLLDTSGLIERTDKGVTFTPVYDDLGRLLYINANGTATGGRAYYYCTSEQAYAVNLPFGEVFTLSGANELSGLGNIKVHSRDYSTVDVIDQGSGVTFTASYEGTYGVWINVNDGKTVNNAHIRPQIELGSVATPFQPYAGKLHTVQIGQTVYGGKFDWLTGKLVVGNAKIDLGTCTWTYDDAYGRFVSNSDSVLKKPTKPRTEPFVCSCYTVIDDGRGIGDIPNCAIYAVALASGTVFYVHDNRYTDANDFTQMITGQAVVYPLAEPYTIQLTPTEIIALSGVNTLYGDGTITVTGKQSKTLSLMDRVAALENTVLNL